MTLGLLGHIELPAHRSSGGFDHADIHSPTDRIYVAHTANDSIDVIYCAQDRYVESISGFTAVAGVLVSEARGLVFATNRGENTVSVFALSGTLSRLTLASSRMASHSTLRAVFWSLPTQAIRLFRIRIPHRSSTLRGGSESPKSKFLVAPVGRFITRPSRHSSSISRLRRGSSQLMLVSRPKCRRNIRYRLKDRMVSNWNRRRADCCAPVMQASCSRSMLRQVACWVTCPSAVPQT